jgi:hypothetical protein
LIYRGSFSEVGDKVREQLKGVISDAAGTAKGSEAQKIGDLYDVWIPQEV